MEMENLVEVLNFFEVNQIYNHQRIHYFDDKIFNWLKSPK